MSQKINNLQARIETCDCAPCRALSALLSEAGAKLRISPNFPGRLCELAVVAAAGSAGLTSSEAVQQRRNYARHLGLLLDGPEKDHPEPIHIRWATKYSNHTPNIKPSNQPINLGKACARKVDDRYYLTWESGLPPSTTPILKDATTREIISKPMRGAIEIDWPAGTERIELDLGNLGEHTQVRQTTQTFKLSNTYHVYETTSTITPELGRAFRLRINYDPKLNEHISIESTWWGTTTITLSADVQRGTAVWEDDHVRENNGKFPFRIIPLTEGTDIDHEVEADEQEIMVRDLAPTDKALLIKARRGQGIFRAKVLQIEPRCRLTGTADPVHLRASHIKAWAASTDRERLDGCNGLMLAPHVDHLFDRALISFDDQGQLLILNNQVRALLIAWGVDVGQEVMQPRPFSKRQCVFLKNHRERFDHLRSHS